MISQSGQQSFPLSNYYYYSMYSHYSCYANYSYE